MIRRPKSELCSATMSASTRKDSLPGLLILNPSFVLVWLAAGIAAFGDHLSEMALLKERGGLERDDVTRVQALLTFGFFLPYVLLGPLAGWWADRFSRKWTMIATDLLRAAVAASLMLSVPWLLGLGFGDYAIVLPLLLTGCFAAFFSPCRQAMLPTLIRDDQLVRANAMMSAIGTIGAIFSGMLGGKLVDLAAAGAFDLHWNYYLNAFTFLTSAGLLTFVSLRRVRTAPRGKLQGIWSPIQQGFQYVLTHRRVLQMILLGTVFWAAAGVVISVIPAIVRDVFGGRFSDAGIYRGLIAVGLVAGSALLTWFGPALPIPLAVCWGLLGGGLSTLALDATYIFKLGRVPSAACLLLIGLHGAVLLVSMMVVIQRFVPDARRGRVCGVSDMCTMGAIVASTALLGMPNIPGLDRFIPWILALTGLALLAALRIAWVLYRRPVDAAPFTTLVWWVVRFYGYFWCRLRRSGPNTIPRNGPVILAANHTAGVDPILLQATTTHRLISFLVAQEYYGVPVAREFMKLVDCVPIDRRNPGRAFLTACLKRLKEGKVLGVFPQGTFERPGATPPEPKAGIGLLALRAGATVIPVHISGTRYFDNPFRSYFSRHEVRIRYGPPIDFSDLAGRERDPNAPQLVSERIMDRINELAPDAESLIPRVCPV